MTKPIPRSPDSHISVTEVEMVDIFIHSYWGIIKKLLDRDGSARYCFIVDVTLQSMPSLSFLVVDCKTGFLVNRKLHRPGQLIFVEMHDITL